MAMRYNSFTPAEDPNDFAYETVSYDLSLLFLAIVVALILAFLLWAAYAKGKSDTRKALRRQRERSAENIYEAVRRALDKVIVSTTDGIYAPTNELLAVLDSRLGKTLALCSDIKKLRDTINKALDAKDDALPKKDGAKDGTILVPVNLNFGGTTPGTPPVGIVSPAQVYTGGGHMPMRYQEHRAAIRMAVEELDSFWRNKQYVKKLIIDAQEELLYSEDIRPEIDILGVSFDGAPRQRRRRNPFTRPPEEHGPHSGGHSGGGHHQAPSASYAEAVSSAAEAPRRPEPDPTPPPPKKRRRPGLA
ncbi:hypothetical protein Q1W73_09740 [Asticcacaulis sp. ZE23SCel15]|uniref:hypothetical protein n=1 Tax=Asticcacaulis sp. ZE23SCel15 TaxID=3059027 RepID=UPI002660135C|nr:hypothetical protein [Asticcacaulis sp. ZE23SCel15]WKL55984.1 hypothetical protein Q1W73_09740 [Asticcacaulis sp. ZE23SCel15]